MKYLKKAEDIQSIPIEYYKIQWYSFANNSIKFSQLPSKIILVDRSEQKLQNRSDYFISKIIDDYLDKSENAALSLLYRNQKEQFASQESMQQINQRLSDESGGITSRNLSISMDISGRNSWDSNLTLYIDNVPFRNIGKGEQGAIKTKLAIQSKIDKTQIIMLEEPETNLSYTNLNILVSDIIESCCEKQLIITTHSTFLMNKIGLDKVIFLSGERFATMKDISKSTRDYFMKLPGYDTLRMIIAKKTILVEGPSDELIVQKAYKQRYDKLPIEDGIDVISVRSLSFKRFLEIASILNKDVSAITDNDGDYKKAVERYSKYADKVYLDEDNELRTLEIQLLSLNGKEKLNSIFFDEKKELNDEELIKHMLRNKTQCALKIFEGEEDITMPQNIIDAIQ